MRKILTGATVISLGLGAAIGFTAAPAAQASAEILCSNGPSYCWFNNGVGENVSVDDYPGGSAWNLIRQSNGEYEIVTGSGTCAWDDGGSGAYVYVGGCDSGSADDLYAELGSKYIGEYLLKSEGASSGSTLECVIREGNNEIGNFNCTHSAGDGESSWKLYES